MKILIAYDGSQCAEAALDDLTHAGLPEKGKALVVSVAEVWLPPPPPSAYEVVQIAAAAGSPLGLERKYMAASKVVGESERLATKAADRFRTAFPKWSVKNEAVWGSPTWELYSKAKEFDADLIVVGSHGRSALGRLFLGSISQWLLNEARCSVRVARGKLDEPDMPVRLIVGVDGSRAANAAVEQVMARSWPALSEVMVVVADEPLEPTVVGEMVPIVRYSVDDTNRHEHQHALRIANAAAKRLKESGLRATALVRRGSPKSVLIDLAEEWRADCIFVGATGISNRLERFLLGSVAGAVAARAHCSVEVVRHKRGRKRKSNGNRN
ncbi:MAG TPA: universal stress protein [Pyrinomonadaceae bacterium]|jgi:nucleotide-binding universal stress UspA family protein|nr:universal stress protein [Pyrinomonadaceae bacterium]